MTEPRELPPLDSKTCERLDHPWWKGGLGGYICQCGQLVLQYHISQLRRPS